MFLGRNRESRSREAAGRRNSPEAVPRKMEAEKGAYREAESPWNKEAKERRKRRNSKCPGRRGQAAEMRMTEAAQQGNGLLRQIRAGSGWRDRLS